MRRRRDRELQRARDGDGRIARQHCFAVADHDARGDVAVAPRDSSGGTAAGGVEAAPDVAGDPGDGARRFRQTADELVGASQVALGGVGFDPAVLIGSIAAVIGGTVVFGSNTSTLKQTAAVIKAAEAHRAELISQIDLRVVGDGNSRTAANDLGPRPSPYRSRPRLQNGP